MYTLKDLFLSSIKICPDMGTPMNTKLGPNHLLKFEKYLCTSRLQLTLLP